MTALKCQPFASKAQKTRRTFVDEYKYRLKSQTQTRDFRGLLNVKKLSELFDTMGKKLEPEGLLYFLALKTRDECLT